MTPELFSDAMNEIGAKYVEEARSAALPPPVPMRGPL